MPSKELQLISRPASLEDVDFILYANAQIEGERASLTREVLLRDVFSSKPLAFVIMIEAEGRAVALAFYTFAYWASDGPIL